MVSLKKFIYLSIATAIATISLKMIAYFMTGSVGLFSDALESCVNLAAAVIALIMMIIAERPADDKHQFGHTKAEYFSSAIEGGLILLAAFSIIWTAVPKLLHPQALDNLGLGLAIALGASVLNLATSVILLKKGKEHQSITLVADGKHLMTDVWTSVGVLAGIALVKLTGWLILDPIIAIAVGLNIVWTGYQLIQQSAHGLLDSGISIEDKSKVVAVLENYKIIEQIDYTGLMTRQAGQHKFIELRILVKEDWTIRQGHELIVKVEKDIEVLFQTPTSITARLEPLRDLGSLEK